MGTVCESFGATEDGQEVQWFECANGNGYSLGLLDYGAHIARFCAPDRNGNIANVTLGFPSLEGYLQRHPYFGSTVGRFCNRIGKGRFVVDGTEFSLALNNGPNTLHGGEKGFDRYVWNSQIIDENGEIGVLFSRRSPDGEEGYPGNLDVTAKYTLNDQNELRMEFSATSDKTTPVNLTNHSYWNLAGVTDGKADTILSHELQIFADEFVPVDADLIPTGVLAPVSGTPLDFTDPHSLGSRIGQIDADPVGYDHCYALRSQSGELAMAATIRHAESGRKMEVLTTQPGVQLYSSNFLDGSADCGGFHQHNAFCLETQHYPDSPNQPTFPSTLLKPGEEFSQTTVHRFIVD